MANIVPLARIVQIHLMRMRSPDAGFVFSPAILQSIFADHDGDADRDASSPPLSHQVSNAGSNQFFGAPNRTEWFVFDVQPFLRANVGMSKQVLARTGRTSLSQAKQNPRRF